MKLTRLFPALAAAVVAAGCIASPVCAEDQLNEFKPESKYVKYLGRSVYQDDELWFGLTDSGVSFDFTGKHVEMNLMGDSAAFGEQNGARIKVYADDKVVYDKCLTDSPFETIKFDFDESGEHTVRLLKASECANSTVQLENIFVDGDSIKPSANGSHTIEFVGDSITCGYGVDGKDQNEHFLTSTEDGTKTYAYKTAEHFKADISCVSFSGCGAISGYSDNGKQNTQNLMKDFYENTGHSYSNKGGKRLDDIPWDFKTNPELIVINLGTNDSSYTKGKAERIDEFKAAYTDLLKQIRAKNPDSEMLCILGLMGKDLYPAITEAVDAYKSETGDNKINCCEIDGINSTEDGFGSDYHPKEASHERAANTLISKIEELYGWTDHDPAMETPASADTDSSAESSSDDSSKKSESLMKNPVVPVIMTCGIFAVLMFIKKARN